MPVLAHFRNIIIFGDSLSDSGNFPESTEMWWNSNAPKTLRNAIAQFYVPFSNPTNKISNTFTIPMTTHEYPWPMLDFVYLFSQPKSFQSISWPSYFLAMAQSMQFTSTSMIIATHLLTTRTFPDSVSYNYGWGYAVSDKGCYNPYYQKTKSCSSETIAQARKEYIAHRNMENYRALEVPGLYEQVQQFLKNVKKHRVMVDESTRYIFWIGGNDLISASKTLFHQKNPIPALEFATGKPVRNIIKNINILLKALPRDERPREIYIFQLFNPKLTPSFYHHKIIGSLGNVFVKIFNVWLWCDSHVFNLFSNTKIVLVPTYDLYQKNAINNPYFKTRMGKSCELDGGNYENTLEIPTHNCDKFMFWNDVHPAAPMHMLTADLFLQTIRR